MARPALAARIEEFDAASGERILPMRLHAFETVAQATGLPEIFFGVCATTSFWLKVLEFELTEDLALCG
jgi:hypothetical protein